jgi:hypothetical protein
MPTNTPTPQQRCVTAYGSVRGKSPAERQVGGFENESNPPSHGYRQQRETMNTSNNSHTR